MENYEQLSFLDNKTSEPTHNTGRTFIQRPAAKESTPSTQQESFVRRSLPNKASEQSEDSFVRRSLPNKASDGTEESFVRRSLPNKAFDQEYMTEWIREVKFLAEKGIRYVYVKRTPDYGVSQFKYKKTPALFEALTEYYRQVENERANLASTDEVQEVLKSAGISIKHGRNGAIKFIKEASEDAE